MKATHWLLSCLLACGTALAAGEAAAPVELARSSLLTLSGSTAPDSLSLSVRRTAEAAPLVVSELTVAIDGKRTPATLTPSGSWSVPLTGPGGGEHQLAVTVAHDGIREVLEGKFTAAAGTSTGGTISALGGTHKQMLWWALNIAVVLAAVIAISRRMS